MRPDVLDLICCPSCGHETLHLGSGRRPELVCEGCDERYPVVDGIPDLAPRSSGALTSPYRTDTLFNLMASTYHLSLPIMSATVWRCPPMRFVDWANMTLGRAADDWHLSMPVASGMILKHCWGPHVTRKVIAADTSWSMLRRAQKRFQAAGMEDDVTLLHVDVHHLPFRDGVFRSVLSLNGLHAFPHREEALSELDRVLQPGGLLGGSTLIRERDRLANFIVNTYERYGVFPMLRSKHYVLSELEDLGGEQLLFETYGSILFFAHTRATPAQLEGSAGDEAAA